ncbi:MAG: helix-turn-helix domain-containing protein [Acidimicrobiales bacterium]|nr:helix-turn-helix domain-containing protein [Acidimicrobiales bacterium]
MKVQAETTVRPSLMTIEQAGERLGVSTRHMRRLVAERRIPYVKWGHLLRFDPLAIDEWIDQFSVAVSAAHPRR